MLFCHMDSHLHPLPSFRYSLNTTQLNHCVVKEPLGNPHKNSNLLLAKYDVDCLTSWGAKHHNVPLNPKVTDTCAFPSLFGSILCSHLQVATEHNSTSWYWCTTGECVCVWGGGHSNLLPHIWGRFSGFAPRTPAASAFPLHGIGSVR